MTPDGWDIVEWVEKVGRTKKREEEEVAPWAWQSTQAVKGKRKKPEHCQNTAFVSLFIDP